MAVYEFDRYRFEPSVGLLRDGQEVPIPPKEEQLLALLLGRAGHTVTINEIEGCLWPRQCVSYDLIARCVSSLRKILGGHRLPGQVCGPNFKGPH